MRLDISRHESVFDARAYHGVIGVVGVGSLGSALALQLAKLGLGDKMVLFDDDNIEPHNLANQVLYGPNDVGLSKVSTAALMIDRLTGGIPRSIFQKVERREDIASITHLFVCVDSMAARENIFSKCVWMNPNLKYFADGRMGSRETISYSFAPKNLAHSRMYRELLYPDSEVERETGGCGFTLSIGATAMMLACQMTWNFINFENFEAGKGGEIPKHEFMFDASRSHMIHAGYFS